MLHIRAHSQDDIEELKRNMRPERITFKGLDIGEQRQQLQCGARLISKWDANQVFKYGRNKQKIFYFECLRIILEKLDKIPFHITTPFTWKPVL